MNKNSKILIAGYKGLVGSAIVRAVKKAGYTNVVLKDYQEVDLTRQDQVEAMFQQEKPEYIFLAAAKVGGIYANKTYPADFIYLNVMIATNMVHYAYKYGVKKMINLGSSCIYPRESPQPIKEEYLLTSGLEPTNEAYAIAKIAAIKLCRYYNEQHGTNFISAMPTNQYGVGDNFNMETGHLLPMVMRRFHLCKLLSQGDFEGLRSDLQKYKLGWGLDGTFDMDDPAAVEKTLNKLGSFRDKIVLWGDGSVYRELMCSDDLADACLYLMENKDYTDIGEHVNITRGDDIQLKKLFDIVKQTVGFAGRIEYDTTKPNGTPRKIMDATRINSLGWKPKITIQQGVKDFYAWYCSTSGSDNPQNH